jgi:hypothetical protein
MIKIKTNNAIINFYKLIIFNYKSLFQKKIYEILQLYISFFSIIFYFIFYLISKQTSLNFIVIISLINIVTISLSGNARNISILFYNRNFCSKVVNFRLFISILFILISIFLNKFLTYYIRVETYFFISIFFLVISFWVIEPIVAFNELNKLSVKSQILFLLHAIVFIFFFVFLLFNSNENFLALFFFLISLINFLFILNFFYLDKKKSSNKYKLEFKIIDYSYFSSISLVMSAFLIRIILIEKLDSNQAADMIMGFSIANFPGSLIVSFYGAKFLNKDIILPKIFKYIPFIYLLVAFILVFFRLTNLYPPYNELILIILFSIFSSFFIFFSQIFRIIQMSSFNLSYVFLKDIMYHSGIVFLIYIYLSFNFYFYLVLLIISIISFYIYSSTKFYDFKKI